MPCRPLYTVLAFWLACGVSNAQTGWSREQYTSESGLLQNRVHAMERDDWGALIIGTEGGLVRFDGDHFRQIGIPAPEGMRPSRVIDILTLEDGSCVVRDAGSRQYLYKNDQLVPLTGDAPARKPISRFSGGSISVEAAVAAMDPDSVLPGKDTWPYSVRPIPLGGGAWCVRTDHEFLVYAGMTLRDRFPIPMGRWSHLVKLGETPYVFDVHGKAYRIDLEAKVAEAVGMLDFPEPDLRQGQLGWRMYWNPRDNSVSLVAGESLYMLHVAKDGRSVLAEHLDLELPQDCRVGGSVWLIPGQVLALGTDTKGLFIYRRNTMRTLLCETNAEGVNNAYTAQAPFGRGQVLTSSRGVSRLFSSTGCTVADVGLNGLEETAIKLDVAGRYWYGRNDTLFIWDRSLGEERAVRAGVRPLCFLEEEGAMWVGTAKGIFCSGPEGFTLRYPLNEKDLSSRPTSMVRTPEGDIWMATCSGVYRVGPSGGWNVVEGLSGVCARVLAVVDGKVLVGTYGSGAYVSMGGKVRQLPKDDHGFLSHVHAFMPDDHGFLWMSTNQGLFRMRRADLAAWSADPSQRIYYAYYGKRAGIQNAEFNGGCDPAYVRTGDGWASFPTMDGLVWFRPEDIDDAYPQNGVLLESVEVDGVLLERGEGPMRLPWDHQELLVRFSLAYWGDPENARLEYTTGEGATARWVQLPTGRREIRLSALPAGSPKLRVRKVGAAVRNEGDAIVLEMEVRPPFFRTAWFLAACIVAGVLFFILAVRFNAALLRRKNLQLERKVRERTRELMDANAVLRRSLEMKEMLVSIISHDIVTPLRFIARVAKGAARSVRSEAPLQLDDTLDDMARASESLHANAQDLLHWIKRQDGRIELRMRNVAVQGLVQEVMDRERERALDKGLEMVNAVSFDDVVLSDRNVLSIILHNLIANAVTHTGSGHVLVSGQARTDGYTIVVSDTGPGMTEAALRHAERLQYKGALGAMNDEGERDVQGLGLLIVVDLLHLLGAEFAVESVPGSGTRMHVRLSNGALDGK